MKQIPSYIEAKGMPDIFEIDKLQTERINLA